MRKIFFLGLCLLAPASAAGALLNTELLGPSVSPMIATLLLAVSVRALEYFVEYLMGDDDRRQD